MAEHRIERTSSGDEEILGLAPEEPKSPHPALTRPPADPKLANEAGKPKPCPGCGYDLRGLTAQQCPECGMKIGYAARAAMRDRAAGHSTWFDQKAAIYAGIGLTVGMITWAVLVGPVAGPLAFMINFAFTVVVGWTVFFACSLMWIGFNQTLRLTMIQLIGAYGAYAGCYAIATQIPLVGWIGALISFAVLVGLLGDLLDIEYKDAFVIAIISAGVKWITGTTIILWVMGLLQTP